MGYFSNGTEGDMYQERYCSKCAHDENGDCMVWGAHLLYIGEAGAQNVLDLLIPRAPGGIGNGQCQMFVKRGPMGRRTPAETVDASAHVAGFWTGSEVPHG